MGINHLLLWWIGMMNPSMKWKGLLPLVVVGVGNSIEYVGSDMGQRRTAGSKPPTSPMLKLYSRRGWMLKLDHVGCMCERNLAVCCDQVEPWFVVLQACWYRLLVGESCKALGP